MTDADTLPTLQYFGYRIRRDLSGAAAWFGHRWKSSWLFKIVSTGIIGLFTLWIAAWIWLASDLPDAEALLEYQTPLPTVVRGVDGEIVHSYARDRRVQLDYPDFPKQLIEAFISAEDKTFFSHGGVDFMGTANAVLDYLNPARTRRAVGGSTITQQLAKTLLLGDEYSVTRKLKEMILARRIEEVMSKEEILTLYLNEIPLGRRSFGVQAASQAYFNKDVADLELHEMAFLAILPKAPERYGRKGEEQAALTRRAFVLQQMSDNGYITEAQRAAAQAKPLGLKTRSQIATVDAGYFFEEVRRELIEKFGEGAEDGPNSVYAGGLWVRTSLDPDMQKAARESLRTGLLRYHGGRGWAGPVAQIRPEDGDIVSQFQSSPININYQDWTVAMVTDRSGSQADIVLRNGNKSTLGSPPSTLKVGDVITVRPNGNAWRIAVVPDAQGAMIVESAQYGRIFAMQGGFDDKLSDFNRATQAKRQPGSTIKPFVYATALDNGMTPATEIDNSSYCYGTKCIRGGRGGQFPLRYGLEQSQNIMTAQIGVQTGMDNVVDTIERLGISEDADPYVSTTLGSEETTVRDIVAAYAALANHGRLIKPTLIDYVQDRNGKVIWRADERACQGCNMDEWDGKPMPRAGLRGEQAMDARTAFQVMHMLEGVIQRGTATLLRDLNLPLFGKTGTTTGPKDVWFIGGTQRLIAGTYIGFDKPKNMGGYAYGGTIAAPIFKEFIQKTRDRWTAEPPIAPPGIRMVRVDRRTGKRVMNGWPSNDPRSSIIWEAFKPDTEPEAWSRRDELKAKRDEILSLIRKTREAGPKQSESSRSEDRQDSFAEEQGGIY